uniref:Uncharacterized protein n=1 Tax=Anopheles farauti TaxID=69004 RepID=A0A182QJ30_9DIPT
MIAQKASEETNSFAIASKRFPSTQLAAAAVAAAATASLYHHQSVPGLVSGNSSAALYAATAAGGCSIGDFSPDEVTTSQASGLCCGQQLCYCGNCYQTHPQHPTTTTTTPTTTLSTTTTTTANAASGGGHYCTNSRIITANTTHPAKRNGAERSGLGICSAQPPPTPTLICNWPKHRNTESAVMAVE